MAEKITDTIEFFIKELIDGNEQPEALLKRNELAARFGCAPSQINY
ncbi:MAG: CtsR family transcriptional regulator, partial [Clostridia bacterium]|nr:CtsR family transcriptional regulator [Clostridia bacterium]